MSIEDIGFAPKEVVSEANRTLRILEAWLTDDYGPQFAVKVEVIEGENVGYVFTDYSNRDENTGKIKQGGKAWSIFEACLGKDFYNKYGNVGTAMEALKGKALIARVTQTRTASRNKLEFGTIGPYVEE